MENPYSSKQWYEDLTDNLTSLTNDLTDAWEIRTIRYLQALSVSLPVSLLVRLPVRIHFCIH